MLQAVSAQAVTPNNLNPPGPDLHLTDVTIYTFDAADEALRNLRIDPQSRIGQNRSALRLFIGATGHFSIRIYLAQSGRDDWLSDLDAAIEQSHLYVGLAFSREIPPSDRYVFEAWLGGGRFDEDHVIWSEELPEIELIQRSL